MLREEVRGVKSESQALDPHVMIVFRVCAPERGGDWRVSREANIVNVERR